MRFFRPSVARIVVVLLSGLGAQYNAVACQPTRIDVSLAPQTVAIVATPLRLNVEIKDESGRTCPADRDYSIHLRAFDSGGQNLPISHGDVTISRLHSE